MPELIEVEYYRLDLNALLGNRVECISVNDSRAIRPKGEPAVAFDVLLGEPLYRTWRRGKLLLAEFGESGGGETLAIRFGMTGRLLVDGLSRISHLEYASKKNDPKWDRFEMRLGGHLLTLRDQRCLGSVEIDPDLSTLAPEASVLQEAELASALGGRTKALKAVLLDQSLIAGLGNLLADEVLWRSGIAPSRPAHELTRTEIGQLSVMIRETIRDLTAAGGSNCGDSFSLRMAGAVCSHCAGSMVHGSVGGRSSWWCSAHQR